MKIYLATDHAGFELKESLARYLETENSKGHLYEVIDSGAYQYARGDDYTTYIHNMMRRISLDWKVGSNSRAIIFGGSGEGEAMVANKYAGARATTYYGANLEIVKLGREHNDANILSIGARFVNENEMLQAVEIFLDTKFSNEERHIRRVANIDIIKQNINQNVCG